MKKYVKTTLYVVKDIVGSIICTTRFRSEAEAISRAVSGTYYSVEN